MKLGEFQFIDIIRRQFNHIVNNEKGIGDDCAVIPFAVNENYLITTDALIEGVHFTLDTISFHELGWKSIAVNLSDIAAMGGLPKYVFITIAVPKEIPEQDMLNFYNGVNDICKQYKVLLLGGDTTGSLKHLCVSVTALGIANHNEILLRSGAQIDDYLYVTGTLGDSRAGLALILEEIKSDHVAAEKLITRHFLPTPRIQEMLYLKKHYKINSAIDISDGLSSDLSHILQESQVGAQIDWQRIPKSRELLNIIATENLDKYILDGGEDYEILFSSPDDIDSQKFFTHTNTLLSKIGRITGTTNLVLNKDNTEQMLLPHGYDHFNKTS